MQFKKPDCYFPNHLTPYNVLYMVVHTYVCIMIFLETRSYYVFQDDLELKVIDLSQSPKYQD